MITGKLPKYEVQEKTVDYVEKTFKFSENFLASAIREKSASESRRRGR